MKLISLGILISNPTFWLTAFAWGFAILGVLYSIFSWSTATKAEDSHISLACAVAFIGLGVLAYFFPIAAAIVDLGLILLGFASIKKSTAGSRR